MVLSPFSTVGKRIRAKELSDKEAYEEITDKWRKYWWGLYIEAGSGNFNASVAGRLELVEHVSHFVHEKGAILLTGGGIRTKEQVADAVRRVKNALWKPEGGIIAQCEFGLKDPTENIETVFETWESI